MMTIESAVKQLRELDPADPDAAHSQADQIVLEYLKYQAPEIAKAYDDLVGRCAWWATA